MPLHAAGYTCSAIREQGADSKGVGEIKKGTLPGKEAALTRGRLMRLQRAHCVEVRNV
jgi:hypothetical protein